MTAIKESSDNSNTIVVPERQIGSVRTNRGGLDYLALAIATCGVGYMPIAPGTWGSLLAVGIYLLLHSVVLGAVRRYGGPILFLSPYAVILAAQLALITLVTLIGIWAASRAEKVFRRKDPGRVVIDEVSGQLIALLPVITAFDSGWLTIIGAFFLFRFFDIVKPYPARRLEGLESGLGIMADDVVAGAYAAVGVSFLVLLRWLLLVELSKLGF